MGLSHLYKSRLRASARVASIGLLNTALVLSPIFGQVQDAQAFMRDFGAGQGISQLGQLASLASSVASSASGANGMLKGKQQMACCQQGCDGAGKAQQGEKAGIDAGAQSAGEAVKGSLPSIQKQQDKGNGSGKIERKTSDLFASATPLCTRAPAHAKFLLDLFRPQKVEAAAGCADALMSMATGAAQMLAGLLGMMAAQKNGKNAQTNGTNYGNLANPATSIAAPKQAAGADLNGGAGNNTGIQIDPALLRDGKAASIFSEFERNFGIPRDDFAKALADGVDPRQLLMNAPKNALTADDLNQAFAAAKNMSPEQRDAAVAAAGLGDMQRDLASKIENAAIAGGGGKSPTKYSSSSKELDDLGDMMGKTDEPQSGSLVNSDLSPELQAALANRESEQMRDNSSIFMVVHRKYQQKMRMIYGFDAYGKSIGGKGVANADGF